MRIQTINLKRLMAILGMAMSSMVAHAQEPLTQLDNQAYALCAGAISFVFDQVAYANCQSLFGTSISSTLSYPPVSLTGQPGGNIETVNQLGMRQGTFIVSTYSTPVSLTSPQGATALYTCPAGSTGSYAQCDGGICFRNTTNTTFPGLGPVFKSTNCLLLSNCNSQRLSATTTATTATTTTTTAAAAATATAATSYHWVSNIWPYFPAFKARIVLIYVMLLCKMDQLYILVLRLERLKLCTARILNRRKSGKVQ